MGNDSIFNGTGSDYNDKLAAFQTFHRKNRKVWQRFQAMAQDLINKGYRHYSHDTLIAVIRFQQDIEDVGEDYKIANEYKAFYGRAWMKLHGDKYPRFFHLRQMKGEPDEDFEKYYQGADNE